MGFAIRFTNPGGIIPRLSARRLPENGAQVSSNVSVEPGEWRPIRKLLYLWEPTLATEVLRSIYRVDADNWWVWPTAGVRVEKAPLEGETRYIISGDGAPRVTTLALASPVSASGKPASTRMLGIPAPAAAPSVGHSGGTGAADSRIYVYTWVSDWNEESAPSPASALFTGKVDGTWAITGMTDTPPNSGSVTGAVSGGGGTYVDVTLGANPHYLRVSDEVTFASVGGMTQLNGTWTVLALPASNKVRVGLVTGQTYTSGGTWARTANWGACTKRIYRTVGSSGDYQLVAEGVTGTSYNDTILDADLPGSSLITATWDCPPATLTNIVQMPGGMLAGFVPGERIVRFCEPFQPHAWPSRYNVTLPHVVAGMAVWDNNLGVATEGLPVVFTGNDPAVLSQTRHSKPAPCQSGTSVCAIGTGIVWATKSSLVLMDLAGVGGFTEQLFLPDQWYALQPENMACMFDGTRLYVTTPVDNQMFAVNVAQGGAMSTIYQLLHCAHADPQTGELYIGLGTKVYQFDAPGNSPVMMDWMSREFVLATPVNIGVAKVERDRDFVLIAEAAFLAEQAAIIARNQATMAETRGARGALGAKALNTIPVNGSILEALPDANVSVAFQLYSKGQVVYSAVLPNDDQFRLPKGFKSDAYAVRIQANTQISAILLGETPADLRTV